MFILIVNSKIMERADYNITINNFLIVILLIIVVKLYFISILQSFM